MKRCWSKDGQDADRRLEEFTRTAIVRLNSTPEYMKEWLNKEMSERDLHAIQLRSWMSDKQADEVIDILAKKNVNPNN